MNILVTGCAGFIGYSLTNKILTNKNFKIFGIDNLNKYYYLSLVVKKHSLYFSFNFK